MVPSSHRSAYAAPGTAVDARPVVIFWYRVYAAVMAIASFAALVLGSMFAYAATEQPVYGPDAGAGVHLASIVLVLLAAALTALFVCATFVPYRPWGWSLALVAIAMGLTSAAIVVALPLLLAWLKPTTKAAFARL